MDLRVALGELQLQIVRKILIVRDADDDGVTARHHLPRRQGGLLELFDLQIALLRLLRRGLLREGRGGSNQYEGSMPVHRIHLCASRNS